MFTNNRFKEEKRTVTLWKKMYSYTFDKWGDSAEDELKVQE